MRLGLVTYNIAKDWDLETLIQVCETVGIEGVELRTTHRHGVEPTLSADERQKVRQRFEQTRVKLVGLGTTCEFHSPNRDELQRQIETAKQFIVLAHDVGAVGVKVRPNGLPEGVPKEKTIRQIGEALRELGDFATGFGIEVWLEVHGRGTSDLGVIQAIMEVANHPQVGVCWNSNREDIVDGSVKANFERVRKWVRHAHINELWREDYPWRELFGLLRDANYEGWTMAEIPESADAVRLLRYYRALWRELTRP
ncbi:MAG: hypothetical protein KEFWMYNX_000546 [Candidatus Fervidibacter sp.]|jgi:Xylose isomerase-like TIM barrel.